MRRLCPIFLSFLGSFCALAASPHVVVQDERLVIDGKPAPYLFGAEVQYFRARGGPGRNVPPATVEKLWEKLIRRVVEAHMNTVSLYIPWDFHEPEEGVFDFTGTLDLDHDGKPDYPSRNVRGFLKLLVSKGIQRIIVRPGPYINAEWGPTGFGAVPLWFLNRYPGALSVTRTAGKPRTVSFSHPIFRSHARKWLQALHDQVLKDYIGPGKPILLLQLDNETNYFWDSVYERDYNPCVLARYRSFVRGAYGGSLARLNATYGARLAAFDELKAPVASTDKRYGKIAWHYDWYLFHDLEIRDYYRFLRHVWEDLGVREPDVVFTSCDSFNANPNGLLPRLDFREDGRLSLTTMNIYPKTHGSQAESTLNTPMKGAHDAALIGSSHRQFYKTAGNWVLSSETVGGWFPNQAEVSVATREHTYASLIGGGVKAMIIYYFHEGWNWDGLEKKDSELRFDAPLDEEMEPRPSYALLKDLGAALQAGLGDRALRAAPALAPVLIAHDSMAQYPLPGDPDALTLAGTGSASLFGLLREAGFPPQVAYLDRMTDTELHRYRLIVWSPPGYASAEAKRRLETYVEGGGTVLVIGDSPLVGRGRGKILRMKKSPAEGWDSDQYTRLPSAQASIDGIRKILGQAGVTPWIEARASDGKPFLHAWTRIDSSSGRALLFVENFLRSKRTVSLRFSASALPSLPSFHLVRRFSPDGALDRGEISAARFHQGISLPVTRDGVDIWELEPGA